MKATTKKLLSMLLVVALVAGIAVTGTLAYLTSEDGDVNVMTLGNVKIAQHEYERATDENGNYITDIVDDQKSYVLDDFTQGKPLYPATALDTNGQPYNFGAGGWDTTTVRMTQVDSYGNMQVFDNSNAQDKFVTVENTGKNDAYVRTLVALELGDVADFDKVIGISSRSTKDDSNFNQPWFRNEVGIIEIDGNNYMLNEFIYHGAVLGDGSYRHANGVLPAGETSYPNLCQVYMQATATNEDCEKIDGNKNGTYDILVFSQAVQAAGFDKAETALDAAFGDITTTNHPWVDGVNLPVVVEDAEELQEALDNAAKGNNTIVLNNDIEGDLVVTQKADSTTVIEGNGNTFDGVITVDGKSATITSAGFTIKNVNFVADSISADACIRLGDNTNATRYTCNVTVENCTFDVPGAVGVKSYTGGDKNLTIRGCTATANAHSLVQAKGIDGILVENCTVNSKNGMNFNNSTNVTVLNCNADVKGYAVRFGESSGGAGTAETYLIKDCTLKSANDGDAVIVLRGTADYSTLTIVNTTITGTPDITNTATGATVIK